MDLDGDGTDKVPGGSFNECSIVAPPQDSSCVALRHRLAKFSISVDAPATIEPPPTGEPSIQWLLGAMLAAGVALTFGGLALMGVTRAFTDR